MFSIPVSPLPPSFLDTYSLSTSSLWCNALCMLISFLVLWFIWLSSSLVHFKNCPEYLTGGTAQVIVPLIWFLLPSFVSSTFMGLLGYSFLIFSFISTCLMVSDSNIHMYLKVFYFSSVLIFPGFGHSIPSVRCRLPLFTTSLAHFSMPNSIPMSWQHILTACIWVSNSFSSLKTLLLITQSFSHQR